MRLYLAIMVAFLALESPSWALEAGLVPTYQNDSLLGPEKAKGVIIYNHGQARLADPETSPPPYLSKFPADGWDVYSLTRPKAEDRESTSVESLKDTARHLRQMGYKKVVTLGQSFGGWISIEAAAQQEELFDAVIVTAPAAHGSSEDSTRNPLNWQRNAEIVEIAKGLRHLPLILFLFKDDSYDPGGRGPGFVDHLAKRQDGSRYAVIDQPEGFEGHGAARSLLFSQRFGDCITAFADSQQASGPYLCPEAATQRTLRLPDGVTAFAAPSPDDGLNRLLGVWSGWYQNGRELLFAIESVSGDQVTAIYAWGPSGGGTAGWERVTGHYDSTGIRFDSAKKQLHVMALPDGQVKIRWSRPDGSSVLTAFLARRE